MLAIPADRATIINGGRPLRATEGHQPVAGLIRELIAASILHEEDWDQLPVAAQNELLACPVPDLLLPRLVQQGLLTQYQGDRVEAGKTFGLLLGPYRILDRLGAGAMGVVFKAEHVRMRRTVAVKVLSPSHDRDPRLLQRFYGEIRAIAQLQHPNIVAAMDAGATADDRFDAPTLHYLVMEYVPGQDLEERIRENGALPVAKACDIAHQLAAALAEANKHNLVHRDIKPSNVRVTPEGQVKLLDFGLSRHFSQRMTEPGIMLGTMDYMAPEQARDASAVDIRADLFGLGGVLFWCLTGRPPFESSGNGPQDVVRRLTEAVPSARKLRPEIPAELDAVLTKLLALRPEDRYDTPQAVMRALMPFLKPSSPGTTALAADLAAGLPSPISTSARARSVLLVDDEPSIRTFCRYALQTDDLKCDEAADGQAGLDAIRAKPYDLVLLDVDMPVMNGMELLRRLREQPPWPHLKVVMFSGRSSADEMAQMMVAGADDYLTKPFSVVQLRARVKAALRLKEAQDRSALLNRHLLAVNSELEGNLTARDSDLVQARNALVLALAKLVEYRDSETGAHLLRLQRFSRFLAQEAAGSEAFAGQIEPHFIDMLECCAPLHDIGKVGLPDHILLKPGKLTPDERIQMQQHTVIGADTLREVARQHGFAVAFLQMATDIARHHHERWDGTGYPDRLAGQDIPLSARLVALADVYDALRSRRVYKPALAHAVAVQMMADPAAGQFDPALLQVFLRVAPRFEQIYRELAD